MPGSHPRWRLGDTLMCGPNWGRSTPLGLAAIGVIALCTSFLLGGSDAGNSFALVAWLALTSGVLLLALALFWASGRSSARQYYKKVRKHQARGHCPECRYPVQPEWTTCPECGTNQREVASEATAWLARL